MVASSHNTDWLARSASENPAATAVVEDDRTRVSYAQMNALANEAAQGLSDAGVGVGDITLLEVGLVDRYLIAKLWAHWRVGAAPLVIDQASPYLAQWSGTLREIWDTGPTAAESSPLHSVLLTSGSSGQPLPVRLTRDNVAAAVLSSQARLGNTADDRWLLALPLFHIGGLSIVWRSAAAGGAVVIHQRFDADRAAAAIRDGLVTMASLVPTMLYRILEADGGPYTGMREILLGGAAASRELVERALDAGLPVLQTYGMTETCSQISTVVPGEARSSLGTSGRPLDGIEIATGGAGVGEIVVSGPAVSPGYLGQPDRVGGHSTGDIGYLDENGRLVVLGRADDMVITGGENVYPTQVAEVLAGYRDIVEIQVVGMPDPEWGQALVAIVVGPDAVERSRIEEWAQQRLPRHEIPKRWAFVGAMPLQAGGKVDRTALYDIARSAQ